MEWLRYGSLDADIILYKCSNCGKELWVDVTRKKLPNRCPKCKEKQVTWNTRGDRYE